MTLTAWRIVKAKFARAAFTGQGARTFGGRWNSPGTAVIYASGSESLAILETLVHVQSQNLLARYMLFELTIDDTLIKTVDRRDLPKSWHKSPPPPAAQRLGDAWAAGLSSAVLRVPSVVVPMEWNYLLNPAHPDFPRVVIGPSKPVRFDPRLVKKT